MGRDDHLLDHLEPDERPPVVDRARRDLQAGRPWIAVNRLQSHLAHDPFDAPARDLLVEVHLDMGDLIAAGRVAVATEREDAAAMAAIDGWRARLEVMPRTESHRLRTQGLLNADVIAALGPVGRARVELLAERARDELGEIEDRDYPVTGTTLAERAFVAGCSIGCLGVVMVFGAGVIQVAHWFGL